MAISNSHAVQLVMALSMGIMLFCAVYALPERVIISALILMIPFQFIDSRYGSLNMILTYITGVALFLKRKLKVFPLMAPVFLLSLSYLLSFIQAHRMTKFDHVLYLILMGSNLVLFYMVYNFVRENENPRSVLRILTILNILFILYCCIQLIIGFSHFSLLGIKELSMTQNRKDQRLVGPFTAAGITAEYFVIQIIFSGYLLLRLKEIREKLLHVGIIAANCAFLIATGNRGGIVSLVFGWMLFSCLYRREMGFVRIVKINLVMTVLFFLMSVVIILFTPFNLLFDRLSETKIKGGVPDTRGVTWPAAWEQIVMKPLIGHGPRFRLLNEEKRKIPGREWIHYPHSLYLFILHTLGGMGLAIYFLFAMSVFYKLMISRRCHHKDEFLNGIPNLGIIILSVFLFDQIKVEFLRYNLGDYQHYMFTLLGIFVGFADRLTSGER